MTGELSPYESFRALSIAAADAREPTVPDETFCPDCGHWDRTFICRFCGEPKVRYQPLADADDPELRDRRDFPEAA